MTLKIIAGEFRGRNLRSVKGFMTRPLLGQVREALFNILGERIVDAEVWDLFAGTGASGIESLSRGATRVTFVEKGNQPLNVLKENLEMLGDSALDRSRIVRGDAWEPPMGTEEDDSGEEAPAPNVVFFDPPYQKVGEDPVRAAWRAQRIAERLAPGGILLFHFQVGHLDADDFDDDVEIRTWGKTAVAFLTQEGTRLRVSEQDSAGGGDLEEESNEENLSSDRDDEDDRPEELEASAE